METALKVVKWLYTTVVRPIVLYGICISWTALNKKSYQNSLMEVHRQAELLEQLLKQP